MGTPFIRRLKRLGACGIVGLLGVQGVVAYQPEKSFWEARRGVARGARGGQLAFLSRSFDSSASLVNEFPAIRSVGTSLSPSVGGALPAFFLSRHRGLLTALSPAYGTVRKVWPGVSSGKGRVVVHIQDVHQNAEAQWNIRGAVSDLLKTGQVGVVALEGASEAIDLKPFADSPHRKPVEMAADYFLKENRISGPIHALLTGQGPLPRIQGIDDPVHYEANVQAVRNALAVSPQTHSALQTLQSEIDYKKETVFSPVLLALDRIVTDYRNEKLSLGNYVESLSATVSLPSVSLQAFLHALQTERTLNFKQVEIERGRLIEKLMRTLSPSEINRLMGDSLAYRSGQRRFAEFYDGLKILCRNHGIRLEEYPAMDAYVRYVLLVDGIDPGILMKDMSILEKRALAHLARTSEEKDLIVRSHQAWLAGRLVDFALTPSEWEEWASNPMSLSVDLSAFESFYQEAHARDGAMAKNLWAALKEDDVAVLVTGGFHADGLDRQLVRRGMTVISYVPKITKVDTAQGAAYLSVFTQEKTPLEKLFRGEKLFLSASPIAPAELKIQLPMVVMLVALLTAGNLDPQLLYQALGGIGVIQDVVNGSGYAQAAVVLGAGALIFRCVLKGNVIDQVLSYTKKRGLGIELKIKVWDPLREQVKYYLPWVILGPFLLALLGTGLFNGGLGLLLSAYSILGISGLIGVVPIFIEREHETYSFQVKYDLLIAGYKVGVWTIGAFMLTYGLLSPAGLNLISYADPFFPLIPQGEFKAFLFAAFFGFMAGLLKHVVHNEKTYGHFIRMRDGHLLGPGEKMPLSRTASGKKVPPVPAFSRVKINLPPGVPRETMLDSLFNWTVLNLSGPRATAETIDVLVDRLKEINPNFFSANKELLEDRERLVGDPPLVKQIIHSAVFLPLNAHAVGFRNLHSRWVGLGTTWEGYFYLGEEIWLVDPEKTAQHTDLVAQYGVGMLPAVNYDQSGEALVLSALNDKNRPLTPQEKSNLARWGRTMGDAARERNRGILLSLMIDAAFASRISIDGDYNPTPLNSEISATILRKETRFPWKAFRPESAVYVSARLAGLAQGLAYLKSQNEPLLGIILFRAELIKFLRGEPDNKGRMDAIRALAKTLILQLDPIRQFHQANNDMKALDAAIVLVETIRNENFYSFEERYALVYGKNPGAHTLELTPIGIQQKKLSLLPEAGRKALLSSDREGKRPEKSPPAVSLPRSGGEYLNHEDVKSDEERPGDSSSVLGFEEALLGQVDGGNVDKLNNAISTLRWFYSSGNLSSEEEERLRNVLIQLQEKLWGRMKESSSIVNDLIDCAKSLELGTDEVLFLKKYRDLQKYGQLPSYAAMTAGENEKTETGLVAAHESLVLKLGNGNLLPVGPDETESEGIADDFSDEGDLAPFLNEGVRVVVYRDYFKKGVEHNKNAQKAVLNVVKTLVQRAREAVEGKPLPISKSRSGLYEHGVHQFLTNEYNVFVKVVGNIIVVLWIGPKDKSHGRRSYTADRILGRGIGSRADNLPWQLDKYVVLNPDFSENRSEDVHSIFSDGRNANGNGFLSSLVKGSNSLVYLVTGRPGIGLAGAVVEGISLVAAGLFLGSAPMFLGVLPIFSLLHVGIRVLQQPELKWSEGWKSFFWHFMLAVPYGLIGATGFQEIVGGEWGASVVAVVWQLVSDGVLMARVQWTARRDAKQVREIFVGPGSVEEKTSNSNLRSQLPEIFPIDIPKGEESQIEVEVARFSVSVGGDTFLISHKIPSPLFHSQWGQTEFPIERLTVETLIRDGAEVPIPVGPHGILEFVPHRSGKAMTSVDAEMRHGIPHLQGEKPYNAGSVLMAVLLKEIAGPHVPVRAVLSMTNASALFHLIYRSQDEGRDFPFSQLQRVPAFRIPECEYTFKINNNGVAEYTVAWSGNPGSPSKVDLESAERLRAKDNFNKFIRANEGSKMIRDFGNTSSSQGIRPFNIFQWIHDRYADDRGSVLKNGRYWLTHPYGGAPLLESLGLMGGVKLLGDSFSRMGMVNPSWFVNSLESWGWLDPTGSVFFTSIFVAAIFSLMHPDLWRDLWAGIKAIGSPVEIKRTKAVKNVVLNIVGVFFQRFIGGILFIAFLQAPLLSSLFPTNFINVFFGLLLSNVVHSPLNRAIQELGVQWTARRDAKQVREIFVGPGSVESMLLPESGPLYVEDILGPSRNWLGGVQRRLREPGYARAFEKTFLREANRGRSKMVVPATVPLQLVRLVSFITGRPVNEDGPSTVVNIVRSGDVPEALRSAQLMSAFAEEGRRPPRLVLAGADAATTAALQAGAEPGVVDVVAEPVAPGGQLDPAVLVKGLNGFSLPTNGRFMVFLSNGIQIDPAAVSRLTGEGIEQALKKALLDLLDFVRLSPIDFYNILEVLNHTRTNA